MTEEVRVPESEISGGNAFGPQVVDPDGNIYGTIGVTQSAFIKVNGDTLQNAGQVSFSSETQLDIVSAYTLEGRIDFVLALGFLSAPARIFFAENLAQFWAGQNVSTRPRGVVAGISEFGFCEAWFAGAPSIVLGAPTATVSILHVRLELPFTVNPITGTPATVKPTAITLTAASLGASQMTIGNLCYDEQNDRILFFTELDSVSHLLAYSKANGVEWVVPANGDMPRQARFRNGRIHILRGSTIDVRSADDGSLISSQGGFTGTSGVVRFDSRTGVLYTPTSGSGIEQAARPQLGRQRAAGRRGHQSVRARRAHRRRSRRHRAHRRGARLRHRPPDQRSRRARDAGRRLHLRCGRERSPAEVQEARPRAQPGNPGAGPRPRQCRARGVHRDPRPGGRTRRSCVA
jgi:hypothetical protein